MNALRNDVLVPSVLLFLYVAPLALEVAQIGDKPVNIAFSDFLWLALPLLALTGARVSRKVILFGLVLMYFPALAVVSAILNDGSMPVIFSGISFSMPLMHIVIGYWFWQRFGAEGLGRLVGAYLFLIVGVILSDVLVGSFPRGCSAFEGRWGGCFGPFELYGYPNSPVSFMAILSPLLLYRAWTARTGAGQAFCWVVFAILFITVMMSLSRSSTLSIAVVLFLFLFQMRPFIGFVTAILSGVGLYIIGWFYLAESFLLRGLLMRVEKGVNEDNISGSRFEIWQEAFEIAAEQPFFGRAFEYFSDYSEFGTAHQQYAEIFFKSGAIGLFLYFGCVIYFVMMARRSEALANAPQRKLITACLNCFVAALFFNGVFQSIMSYQPMGNMMFFLGGIALALKAAPVRSGRRALDTGPVRPRWS